MSAAKVAIAVVGTGFAGLGMAIMLKQAGYHDFVILEKAGDVGGVWRDNTYPGCACDVQSHLYSLSFAPYPGWTRMFAPQAEIWDYLRRCAKEFELAPHLRFNHEVRGADWDEAGGYWRIETSQGEIRARAIVSGMGALSEPALPDLPGVERFQGKVFHSARWDHSYALEGRKVAVIGTGASAIQFVPQIQPRVAQLKLFQRTPPWIVPRLDRALSDGEQKLAKVAPLYQKMWRLYLYGERELLGHTFRRPWIIRQFQRIAMAHMRRAIKDPELRAKLTPHYDIGCKRVLLSNDYYPALAQPNVEVVTNGIAEVRPHSIVTRDGVEHAVDAIIYGTGFKITTPTSTKLIRNAQGVSLAEAFGASPKAHLGTTYPGFPNFFMLQGPNTGLGHTSVIMMMEAQMRYVLEALRYLEEQRAVALAPTEEALARFVAEVDTAMQGTVWTAGGCKSWYLDSTGRNSTLWPASVGAFVRRMRNFDPTDYDVDRTTRAV